MTIVDERIWKSQMEAAERLRKNRGIIVNLDGKPPVPKRKPVEVTIPPYRRDVFKGKRLQEWIDFSKVVDEDKTLSPTQRKAYKDIFAAEGGMRKALNGSAVAGILQGTLDLLKKDDDGVNRIPSITDKHGMKASTSDLDYKDIRDAYKSLFDMHFSSLGDVHKTSGSKVLGTINDESTERALSDVVLRDGIGNAALFTQKAIKKIDPSIIMKEDAVFGSKTLDEVKKIVKEPDKRRKFIDALADQRRPYEKDRNDYFRFKE